MADQFSVMRAYDHGGSLPVDLLEHGHDFSRQFWVEVPRWLVRQEYFGITHDSPGNSHSLLLPIRELRRVFPHFVMKIDHPQCVENTPSDLFAGDSKNLQDDCDILENLFLEEKAEVLKNDPHTSSQSEYSMVGDAEDIPVVDDDLPLSRKNLSEDQFEERRFARAAGPGNEGEISFLNVKSDIRKSPFWSLILFPYMVEFDHFTRINKASERECSSWPVRGYSEAFHTGCCARRNSLSGVVRGFQG